MNNSLQELAQCGDVQSLDSAIRAICSDYGPVSRLRILCATDAGKPHAVCFLRLASPSQEHDLMSTLGAFRFGDELCVVVDLGVLGPQA